jgi:hypothetical protein
MIARDGFSVWCNRCGRPFEWDYELQERTGSGRWIPCECGAKAPLELGPDEVGATGEGWTTVLEPRVWGTDYDEPTEET